VLKGDVKRPPISESANAQIFSHYESANQLPRKRNIDRYREPQQRFAKPQTGLYTSRDVVNCRAAIYRERRKQYGTLPKSAFETIDVLREIAISTHKKEDFLMFL